HRERRRRGLPAASRLAGRLERGGERDPGDGRVPGGAERLVPLRRPGQERRRLDGTAGGQRRTTLQPGRGDGNGVEASRHPRAAPSLPPRAGGRRAPPAPPPPRPARPPPAPPHPRAPPREGRGPPAGGGGGEPLLGGVELASVEQERRQPLQVAQERLPTALT